MDDEVAAGKRYTDEVIEVNGTVRGVSAPQGGKVSVLLETGNPLAAVVCSPSIDVRLGPRLNGNCERVLCGLRLGRCPAERCALVE